MWEGNTNFWTVWPTSLSLEAQFSDSYYFYISPKNWTDGMKLLDLFASKKKNESQWQELSVSCNEVSNATPKSPAKHGCYPRGVKMQPKLWACCRCSTLSGVLMAWKALQKEGLAGGKAVGRCCGILLPKTTLVVPRKVTAVHAEGTPVCT